MSRRQAYFGFSLLLTTFALSACGGKSSDTGDSNGGTESGGRAQGGETSHGGTATGGAEGGTAPCDAYNDEGPAYIAVRIANQTTAPIYLGPQPSCGTAPFFNVSDATDKLRLSDGFCLITCQELLTDDSPVCLAVACPVGPVLTLQPGEDTVQRWNGLYEQTMTLAPTCHSASGESTCQRIAAIKPGAFTFTATAGTKLDCSTASCMTCTPSSSGGCTTFGAAVVGPMLSAETNVMLDGSYGLGGPGGGTARSVEIVFKE